MDTKTKHEVFLIGPRTQCSTLMMEILAFTLGAAPVADTKKVSLDLLVEVMFYESFTSHRPMMTAKFHNFHLFNGLRVPNRKEALSFSKSFPEVLVRSFNITQRSNRSSFNALSGTDVNRSMRYDEDAFWEGLGERWNDFYEFKAAA